MAEMDDSLRQSLSDLVSLQTQQMNVLNGIASQNARMAQRDSQLNQAMYAPHFASSYQNYAPSYTPPMAPFMGGMNIDSGGSVGPSPGVIMGGIHSLFPNPSRVSYQNATMMANDYASRASNATLGFGQNVAGFATDLGASALAMKGASSLFGMGAVGSLVTGTAVGMAAAYPVGKILDIAMDQNNQTSAYNKSLLQNSYRFVNPLHSNNTRDVGGFSTSERFQASNFLRNLNVEKKISSEDVMTMFQGFTEGNLFKGVQDLESFKGRMSKLTDYVKKSALVLNETFSDVTKMMADLNKSGIGMQNFDYLASKSKVLGSFTGMSATDVMKLTTSAGMSNVQGTGMSLMNATLTAGDTLLYVDEMYNRSKTQQGLYNPRQTSISNMIGNMGGVQGASAVVNDYQNNLLKQNIIGTNAVQFFDYDQTSGAFTLNRGKMNAFFNSGARGSESSATTTNILSSMDAVQQDKWMKNYESIIRNGMSSTDINKFIKRNLNALQGDTNVAGKSMSTQEQLSLLMGDSSTQAKLFGEYADFFTQDGGELQRTTNLMSARQNQLAAKNAARSGLFYGVKGKWDQFKNAIGDTISPLNEGFTRMAESITDMWYGKEYKPEYFSKGATPQGSLDEGMKVSATILEGVKEGLKKANVKEDVIKMFSLSPAESRELKEGITKYKREVFGDVGNLSKDFQGYYGDIKTAGKATGVSDTSIAAVLEYRKRSGTLGSGPIPGQITDISNNMGKLLGAYGGNEQLAMAALVTSQKAVDASLKGYDIEGMRSRGEYERIKNISVSNVYNNMTSQDSDKIRDVLKGKNISGKDYKGELKFGRYKQSTDEMLRQEAKAAGVDLNLAATIIARESEGDENVAPMVNNNGTVDYGIAQLNTSGYVKNYFGKKMTLANGETVDVGNNDDNFNWRYNSRLNARISFETLNTLSTKAQSNPYVVAAMYHAGDDTALGIIKGHLEKKGVTGDAMNAAIKNMSYQDVRKAFEDREYYTTAKGLDRFHEKYQLGAIQGGTGNTSFEDVVKDKEGKVLTGSRLSEYEKRHGSSLTQGAGMFSRDDLKKAYDIQYKIAKDKDNPFELGTFKVGLLGKDPKDVRAGWMEDLKGVSAKMLGVGNYNAKDPESQIALNEKSIEMRRKVFSLANEYKNAKDKGSTEWGKLSLDQKTDYIQMYSGLGTILGVPDTELPGGVNEYFSSEENKKIRRTQADTGGSWGLMGVKTYGQVFSGIEKNINLPNWMMPGSDSKFVMGLKDVSSKHGGYFSDYLNFKRTSGEYVDNSPSAGAGVFELLDQQKGLLTGELNKNSKSLDAEKAFLSDLGKSTVVMGTKGAATPEESQKLIDLSIKASNGDKTALEEFDKMRGEIGKRINDNPFQSLEIGVNTDGRFKKVADANLVSASAALKVKDKNSLDLIQKGMQETGRFIDFAKERSGAYIEMQGIMSGSESTRALQDRLEIKQTIKDGTGKVTQEGTTREGWLGQARSTEEGLKGLLLSGISDMSKPETQNSEAVKALKDLQERYKQYSGGDDSEFVKLANEAMSAAGDKSEALQKLLDEIINKFATGEGTDENLKKIDSKYKEFDDAFGRLISSFDTRIGQMNKKSGETGQTHDTLLNVADRLWHAVVGTPSQNTTGSTSNERAPSSNKGG
jgi:hypothetical protein